MTKVVCVLYDDPVDGYPKTYARDGLPKIDHYPGGQTLPTPKAIEFTPGVLLGSVSGELGLRKFLESQGHTLVVTSDKDGPDSAFERELPDADIVISQPFVTVPFGPHEPSISQALAPIRDRPFFPYPAEASNAGRDLCPSVNGR